MTQVGLSFLTYKLRLGMLVLCCAWAATCDASFPLGTDSNAAVPLWLQLPAHGKAAKTGSSAWAPEPLGETCAEFQALGFGLAPPLGEWINRWMIPALLPDPVTLPFESIHLFNNWDWTKYYLESLLCEKHLDCDWRSQRHLVISQKSGKNLMCCGPWKMCGDV